MVEQEIWGGDGIRCLPEQHSGVGVLVLAGSSGRIDTERARVFAGAGAIAESVRWFGGRDQNPGPWEIPLETFHGRVSALREECDRIVVVGTSFGSEAALLTGAFSQDVDAVVAFAPSDVVWAGVTADGRVTSHWTWRDETLPYVPFDDEWSAPSDPPAYVGLYSSSRKRFGREAEAATIPVERIKEVLLVAGGDDQVWPSVLHADSIRDRRALHGCETTVVTGIDAGHRTVLPGEPVVWAGMRMKRGGTEEADRSLGVQAWALIRALLS